MEKREGKEMPWEQQRELLIERLALKQPLLYKNLFPLTGKKKEEQCMRSSMKRIINYR